MADMNDLSEGQKAILEKVGKLLNVAAKHPGTPEGDSAAEMARKLMVQYNIDQAFIELQQGRVDGKREKAQVTGGFYQFQRDLYASVAELNFCMHFIQEFYDVREATIVRRGVRYEKGSKVQRKRHLIVGRQVNTAAAKNMAEYLMHAIDRVCRERLTNSQGTLDYTQLWSNWGVSFREGAVDNIVRRIAQEVENNEVARKKAEKAARRSAEAKASGVSTATALTLADVRKSEEEANYDFLYGEGAWTRREQRRKEREDEWKREMAYRRKLSNGSDEDKAKLRAIEKEEREAYRGMRSSSSRERSKDWGAYEFGDQAGKNISLHRQTGSGSAGKLTHG